MSGDKCTEHEVEGMVMAVRDGVTVDNERHSWLGGWGLGYDGTLK